MKRDRILVALLILFAVISFIAFYFTGNIDFLGVAACFALLTLFFS